MSNKLYRVTLKGMTTSYTSVPYGIAYVVAEDTEKAYQKVRGFLDRYDLGYPRERELDKIELVAEDEKYTNAGAILYL